MGDQLDVDERAERLGDAPAVRSLDGDLSFAQVRERAAAVAQGLREVGVGAGDRVATMLDSTIDYLAAWHGITWAAQLTSRSIRSYGAPSSSIRSVTRAPGFCLSRRGGCHDSKGSTSAASSM